MSHAGSQVILLWPLQGDGLSGGPRAEVGRLVRKLCPGGNEDSGLDQGEDTYGTRDGLGYVAIPLAAPIISETVSRKPNHTSSLKLFLFLHPPLLSPTPHSSNHPFASADPPAG